MRRKSSKLLIAEPPLILLPSLAAKIGMAEAIIIHQLHYWIEKKREQQDKKSFINGRYWVWNTYSQWRKQFPMWDEKTISRAFKSLEEQGLVLAEKHRKKQYDHTKFYTIDYEKIDALEKDLIDQDKLSQSAPPDCLDDLYSEITISKTTHTETTVPTGIKGKNNNARSAPSNVEAQLGEQNGTIMRAAMRADCVLSEEEKPFASNELLVEQPELTQGSVNSQKTSCELGKTEVQGKDQSSVDRISSEKRKKPLFLPSYDERGYLRLPIDSKQYKFPAILAIRRMQFILGEESFDLEYTLTSENSFLIHSSSNPFVDDEFLTEEEAFGSNGHFPLGKMIDIGSSRSDASRDYNFCQTWYNNLLQRLFEECVDWCREHGKDALKLTGSNSIAYLFNDVEWEEESKEDWDEDWDED